MSVVEDAVRARDGHPVGGETVGEFAAIGRRRAWRRFAAHRTALVGAVVLVVMALACWIGPWFLPGYRELDLEASLQSPSWSHWFGTDHLGRDLLARVLVAGRSSLLIAVGVAVGASVIGAVVGVIAGARGGFFDTILMALTDLWLVLPALPVLAVAATIGTVDLPGPLPELDLSGGIGIAFVLSLLLWSVTARVVRSVARTVRERDFVAAARASGVGGVGVVARHVLPHCLGPVMVEAALLAAGAILLESTLSFLGFGVQPPTPTWGNLLDGAVANMQSAWWLAVFPGVAIFVTVLSIYAVSDGLRDAFDARRSR